MKTSTKILLSVIGLLVIATVAEGIWYRVLLSRAKRELREANYQVARADSVTQVTESAYTTLVGKAANDSKLVEVLRQRNDDLAGYIADQELKITSLTEIELQPNIVHVVSHDTVRAKADSTLRVDIDTKVGRFGVRGYTLVPDFYNLAITEDPISLWVLLTESKAGDWKVLVDSPISVSDITSMAVPYRPAWWKHIGAEVAVGYGRKRPIGILGLSYRGYRVSGVFDAYGCALVFGRSWQL